MEKKKFVIIFICCLLSISIITMSCLVANARQKENKRITKEETHTMYVKINSYVKLTFKDKYYLCKNKKEDICEKHFYSVIDYDLVDNDNKKLYKQLSLKDENLYKVILMLCETADSSNILFDKVEIITDDSNFKVADLTNYIKNNSTSKTKFAIYADYQKNINEQRVFNEDKVEKITFLVTFNSDGGSNVEPQTIEEGKKVIKPANPTKKGYRFVEWTLDGKAFNFNTIIGRNITLEAVWKKEATNEKEVFESQENNQDEVNAQNNQNSQSNQNNNESSNDEPNTEPPAEENPDVTQPEETPNIPEETPVVPEETPNVPQENEGVETP